MNLSLVVSTFYPDPYYMVVSRISLKRVHASSLCQDCTAGSTTEAEVIAASAAVNEVVHFRGLCGDLRLEQINATEIDINNTSCHDIANDYGSSSKTRHIARRRTRVQEFVHRGVARMNFVPSKRRQHRRFFPQCAGQGTVFNAIAVWS